MTRPGSGDPGNPFLTPVNPTELGPPRGWTHGFLTPPGARTLYVAGQTATRPDGTVGSRDFAQQFDQVLAKVLLVVERAGGDPEHVARITVYVTDLDAYQAARTELGRAWKARMGRHYPAMALVEVQRLVDPGALVEMEATAVLPSSPQAQSGDPRP